MMMQYTCRMMVWVSFCLHAVVDSMRLFVLQGRRWRRTWWWLRWWWKVRDFENRIFSARGCIQYMKLASSFAFIQKYYGLNLIFFAFYPFNC